MAFSKYASLEAAKVLEVKGAPTRLRTASLDKVAEFDNYRTGDGYLYVRIRAISSRVNKNHDGWPSVELAGSQEIFDRHTSSTGFTVEAKDGNPDYGFATFIGKPHFVDHHNSDPKRARGVVVDAKFSVEDAKTAALDEYYSSDDVDPEHLPASEVELLIEVDAKSFPLLAKKIASGDIDGFSMGCDVERSKCSHCGNIATNPEEYCSHILMKGAHHDYKTSSGKRISKKSYENCYGIKFFEISAVFDPADETALTREVRSSIIHEGENPLPQAFETTAPTEVDTLRQEQICPICGSDMEGETCDVCGYVQPPKGFDNPDLDKAKQIDKEMEAGDEVTIDNPEAAQPEPPAVETPPKKPGSLLQNESPTKASPTASVKGDMLQWTPYVHQKVAARINKQETPVHTISKPVSNEPSTETVKSDQTVPVTSAMLTAQQLIARAQANNTGDTMSQHTAQGSTPDGAAPDKRVDVTGVGGVDQADNVGASKADAQVDVTGIGGTGVEGVEADKHENLPDSDTDNSGFDTQKNQADSGPTKTYEKGKQQSPVTHETPSWVGESQWTKANVHQGYDDTVGDLQDVPKGTAVKGVQPIAESFGERVDVLQAVTSPSNNSGKTDTWSGTDGNKINKQQDPVTKEVTKSQGISAHFIRAMQIADTEVELGLLSKDRKYARVGELEQKGEEALTEIAQTLAGVRTASLSRQAASRTSGVSRLPSLGLAANGRGFQHIAAGVDGQGNEPVDDTVLDSGLFTR